jgi:class 3 adenylate cyclase/tetratricopeptide (TPR) repeat protein
MRDQRTAERRQVTILNADIVNSTKLVGQLDPEELMGIMQEYFDSCRSVVEEFHGVLAGFTGDGFEAYFGYPVAREDYAVEALNAAIQIGRLLAERHSTLPFDCRIGVATGHVAVDQPGIVGLGRNVLAFGSTPTLAARLQQLAKPGSILVDHATMRLCEKQVSFRDVGPVRLKGFELDHELWEVIEPRPLGRRFTLAGLSAYVGRGAELQLLLSRWQSVLAGEGQVVLLHGEAGIGKSRLVYELQKSLPRNSGTILQFQCVSQFTSTPLHPWITSVQRFGNILHGDSAEVRVAKIAQYLGGKLGFADEVVATCASLLGLAPSHDGDSKEQSLLSMARLQDALVRYLITSSRKTPLFILVEDIQWSDASTMNLLHSLVELMRGERILLIMTSRSDKVPIFSSSHVTSLSLVKLSSSAVMELITHLASSRRHNLDHSVAEEIRNRSDGNPLFVEELTRHYIELAKGGRLRSDRAGSNHSVPDVLQGSLMERIDKASRCKETAQLASVIEREFDHEILAALSEEEEDNIVQQHLDILTELQIIHRMTHGARTTYQFSHALLRDAIYSSLLNPVRRSVHRNVAEYFAHDRGDVQNAPPEVIAYHYERAEDHENAFRYWLEAGQQALRAGATSEAADLFSKAGGMAALIGEREDNLGDLAVMYLSHGLALNASRGAGADPLSYFRKAEELSARLGNTELAAEALDWQFGLYFNAGQLTASMAPALKMKQLGSDLDDRTAIAGGCQGLGMAQFMLGNFLEARKEFEFGLKANEGHLSGVHCYPSMSLSYLAWTLLVLGDRPAAEMCADRAIESARQESSESSHALATALSNCCYVYQCMGAVDKVYERTAELVEHTRKFGEEMYLKRGTIIRCWADCMSDKGGGNAIEVMNSEIASLLDAGEEIETTFLLGVLAELQIREQRLADAHATLSRAMAIANKNEEKFYLSELYRLKGMLAEVDPDRFAPADGSDYLAMAYKTAREQHAQAWIDRLPRQQLEAAS